MAEDFNTLKNVSPLLTDEVVSQALTDWFKEPVTFTHWKYVSDTDMSKVYISEVLRIKIYGRSQNDEKHVQVILKRMPRSAAKRLTFRTDEFFKNEINFYTKIFPAMLEFQASTNVVQPFEEYAKLFLALGDGINDVVCLEDASLQDFTSAVSQNVIDLDHCRLCIKVLAEFHALSIALKDQQPEKFEQIRNQISETYFHERLWPWYERFWKTVCGIAIDAVEKEYPDSIYAKKIREFCVPERYQDMVDAATKTLATGAISHGDCWTNNFLFRYEGGLAKDAKIIDFQLARCATPVLDLAFMIYACTSQELRERHYDELLRHYHATLSVRVRALGSDPDRVYSFQLFMDEVKKYSYFGLAISLETTPVLVSDSDDAAGTQMEGVEKLNIDDVWRLKHFKTKEGRLRVANNVVHCVDNGYI